MQFSNFQLLCLLCLISSKLAASYDEKLKFRMCTESGLEIMENMPIGTFVGQIRVKVPYPLIKESPIRYVIARDPLADYPFTINDTTGVIRTNRIFNRDEPDNEENFYVSILITENDEPWLYDSCVLKINITDNNDNAPVFHQKTYSKQVPRNLKVGSSVMKLSAHDIDDGQNSEMRYSILTSPLNSWKDVGNYFRIDSRAGEIFLKRVIDKEHWFKFRFVAKVEDNGISPKFDFADVEIQVVFPYFQHSFFSQHLSVIMIPEINVNQNLVLANFTIESNDGKQSTMTFELLTGRTEQTNKEKTFALESVGNIAQIILTTNLDYERIKKYWLVIRATNDGNIAAETTVEIEVIDINDNFPVIPDVGYIPININENERPGYPVMKIQAIDVDHSDMNHHLSYIVENHRELFTINNETGVMETLTSFEKYPSDEFYVRIYALESTKNIFYSPIHSENRERIIRIQILRKKNNFSVSPIDSRIVLI